MTSSFISITNLGKTYYKRKRPPTEALKGINLDIHSGEVFGLLGVNGAGKTTLSSIIASLHPPTTGDVLWNGRSIYSNLLNYRKIIGFCPQHPNIDQALTLRKNLLLAGRCYGQSQKKAEERAELLMDQLQLKSYEGALSTELSGGYRHRFILARALMHEPKLVILDEPTVGLDPHIRREIWEVIKTLRTKKISIILTTHYLDEAEYLSNRICLIHRGAIRTIDTPQNLKSKHQKNNLEEVFLKFVDDPEAAIFNSGLTNE